MLDNSKYSIKKSVYHSYSCLLEHLSKLKLIRSFMHVLLTCKYKKDRIKTSEKTGGGVIRSAPTIALTGCFLRLNVSLLCRQCFYLSSKIQYSSLPASFNLDGLDQYQPKQLEHCFLKRSRANNSIVSCRIWQRIKLIQALMHVQKGRVKNNREKVDTSYCP